MKPQTLQEYYDNPQISSCQLMQTMLLLAISNESVELKPKFKQQRYHRPFFQGKKLLVQEAAKRRGTSGDTLERRSAAEATRSASVDAWIWGVYCLAIEL